MFGQRVICESYEFSVMKSRDVVITFDWPPGIRHRGGVERVELGGGDTLILRFGGALRATLPDINAEMMAALALAPKVSVICSYADGSVRGTDIAAADLVARAAGAHRERHVCDPA
jgi:hypothetical protein